MKTERFSLAILLIVIGRDPSGRGGGERPVPRDGGADGLNCSPAPCVLPPTQASEGGGTVTDTPIVANPLNGDDLLLGSVDYNCGQESNVGFHLSRDGGSTWKRVECMAAITTKQNNYLALDEPSVSYDRTGTAYIAGIYFERRGIRRSRSRRRPKINRWNPLEQARRGTAPPGQTFPYMTQLAVDSEHGQSLGE